MKILLLCGLFTCGAGSFADEPAQPDSLFSLSLEQLIGIKVKVPGAITKMTRAEQPSSITTIHSQQIRTTPARNLLDLIEIYVPGATWMNSEIGPILGIRGSLLNRNLKYLLLVNNRVMNSKGFFGAKSELEQWELNDIEKVEIIRGPGSVTYGPGAVSGVIKITTKNSNSKVNDYLSLQYVNEYESNSLSVSKKFQFNHLSLFTFASVTRTQGDTPKFYLVDDNDNLGYVGSDFLLDTEPLDYFADYQDEPQVKLHIDTAFSDTSRLWLRYTQQGSNWRGNEVKTEFNGKLLNQQGVRDRQLTLSFQNQLPINDRVTLSNMISADSFDGERRIGKARSPDPDNVLNFKLNYSETEFFLRSILNWHFDETLESAFGIEYSLDEYGTGWGDSDKDLRLGDNADIVNGPDSNAILTGNGGSADKNGQPIFVGDGWSTNTYALITEVNKNLDPSSSLLLSVRADKSTDSDWLISPRAAFVTEISGGDFIHFIAQRSHRLNTAGQVLVESKQGQRATSESLNSLELKYSSYFKQGHLFKATLFWNKLEIISWNGDINASIFVGDHKVGGFEAEYENQWGQGVFGFNYSYVKQLDWKLATGLTRSGISYSDYNQPLSGTNAVQTGLGNDLNNWPNQAFKAFVNWDISERLRLHLNARILWDFQGAKDGLKALQRSVQGEPEEQAVVAAINRVNEVDTYDYDFRLNTSLVYNMQNNLDLIFYGLNILGANRNKRYAEDSGNDDASPRRVRFTHEPASVGIKIIYGF